MYPRPNGDGEVSLLHLKRAATDRFFLFRMTKPGVTLTDETLSIDFEAEALTDCEYEVAYTDTGLELTAGKGTITQGEKYILNRTEK